MFTLNLFLMQHLTYFIRPALLLVLFFGNMACAQLRSSNEDKKSAESDKKHLIFSEDFDSSLDTRLWIVEMEPFPGSAVRAENGKLELKTRGGVTVWLGKILQTNIQIEYTREVIVKGGEYDRLSDLNQFWMAKDLQSKNLFTRHGKFEQYDSLSLYYVGVGGNTNTTTRFRKYNGKGERVLLQEHLDSAHLLQPNKQYQIKIVVKDGATSFFVDGQRYFFYQDRELLKEGYFGFRSTYSHQVIDDLKIYQLN